MNEPNPAADSRPPRAHDPRPVLSICIPTYNRHEVVAGLVGRALACPSASLQIVVSDNASTDGTPAALADISDPRLRVHANGTNRGVIYNIFNALLKAEGTYCVLLLDKDHIDPANIRKFMDRLTMEDVACGYCEYDRPDLPSKVFPAGVDALAHIAFSCHHPTGYFFRRDLLERVGVLTRFSDPEYVGHFSLEFVLAELAMQGNALIYTGALFSPEDPKAAAKVRSFGTNASAEDAFFSPKGRLKMAVNFSRYINDLPIAPPKKIELIAERFMQGLRASTVGYKSVMANRELCVHYHIEPKQVGILEITRSALNFSFKFLTMMPATLSRTSLIARLLVRNGDKLMARARSSP